MNILYFPILNCKYTLFAYCVGPVSCFNYHLEELHPQQLCKNQHINTCLSNIIIRTIIKNYLLHADPNDILIEQRMCDI